MKPLYAAGLGFWAPGFQDLEACLAETRNPAHSEPPCALLPPRLARRASLLTRMTIEAVTQATREAGVDLGQVPTVFATSRGEMQTLCDLLEMLSGDGQLSPTRFHNSVYNAAAGQFSVATGNQAFSTTLVGGNETVPLALLEAFCVRQTLAAPAVVVAFADEAISLPLASSAGSEALACALCLVAEARPGRRLPLLAPPGPANGLRLPRPSGGRYLPSPVSSALPLLRALRSQTSEGPLALGTPDGWQVEILGQGASA